MRPLYPSYVFKISFNLKDFEYQIKQRLSNVTNTKFEILNAKPFQESLKSGILRNLWNYPLIS